MPFMLKRSRFSANRRILCFGDSHTNGVGDQCYLGWPARVAARFAEEGHDSTLYNLGVRWQTSSDIRRRWRAEMSERVIPEHDVRLVFSFGANDVTLLDGTERVSLAETVENTDAILSDVLGTYPVVVVGPAAMDDEGANSRLADRCRAIGKVCQTRGVPYLPVHAVLKASPIWMAEVAEFDGAHPRAKGYALLADMVADWEPARAIFTG